MPPASVPRCSSRWPAYLGQRFHCWGLDLRAHGRSDRPTDGDFAWAGFCADVLAAVDYLGLSDPVGFGHSCGGAAILLAEEARPGTFASLYCFEPVVFDVADPGPALDNPMSEAARRRRETFPSATDAFVNFSSKPPFADLDPEVLQCYVESGFEVIPPAEGGDGQSIRLRCRRDDEAAIYARGPDHGAFGHLSEVTCHVTLSCGEQHRCIRPFVPPGGCTTAAIVNHRGGAGCRTLRAHAATRRPRRLRRTRLRRR